MDDIVFYCLNYNNEKRKANMIRRFESLRKLSDSFDESKESLNLNYSLYNGVSANNERIQRVDESKRYVGALSCMYGHLDMIKQFYDSEKEYAIFCEDDVCINKKLTSLLNKIISDFEKYKLDILLLGYLWPYKITPSDSFKKLKEIGEIGEMGEIGETEKLEYYTYPDDLWGTQMYMLSRSSAKNLLDKYYDLQDIVSIGKPFAADWILTKEGKRALISPIMAIEDNNFAIEDYGQRRFHENCFNTHFDCELFEL